MESRAFWCLFREAREGLPSVRLPYLLRAVVVAGLAGPLALFAVACLKPISRLLRFGV